MLAIFGKGDKMHTFLHAGNAGSCQVAMHMYH
jgi:hypothetical protein